MAMRLQVRAKPGSKRESVTLDKREGRDVIVVRVRARAVEGAANKAVVQAVARALGIRRSAVTLAGGERSRDKWVDVEQEDAVVAAAVADLPHEKRD